MTFLAVLSLNIIIGMFVPYVLIYALLVKPILDNRLYGKRKPQRKKKAKESLQSKVAAGIISVVILGGMAALVCLSWWWALPHWLDLPSAVFQQYEKKSDVITDIEYYHSRNSRVTWEYIFSRSSTKSWESWEYDYRRGHRKSWGYDYVHLNGESYKVESLNLDSLHYGDTVTLYYLKHTKYLMMVSDQKGNIVRHTFSPVSFLVNLLIYVTLSAYFLFTNIRSKVSFKEYSRRKKLILVSFHTFSILIIVLSGFTGRIIPLSIVMTVNGLLHYILAKGGIRAYIA